MNNGKSSTYGLPVGRTIQWQYGDYIQVGSPEGGKRALQTLTKLDPGEKDTSEET